MTVHEIADEIRSGGNSAEAILQTSIDRLQECNAVLNSFVHIDIESARDAARAVDRAVRAGEDPGPFAGVPIGIKDLEETVRGMPTTDGSLLLKGSKAADRDTPHVRRLREAGAVILGRTASSEFGIDSSTSTRAWGITRNPWDLRCSPGGSSGGSAAAVAAGIVPFASGSDSGGSLRSPASHTQLVGFKPSYELVPQPRPGTPFNAVGGLTTTVRDTARHLDVAAISTAGRPDGGYEATLDHMLMRKLRLASSIDLGYVPTDPDIAAVVSRAIEALVELVGAEMHRRPITLTNPYLPYVARTFADFRVRLESEFGGQRELLCEHLKKGLIRFAEAPAALLRRELAKLSAEVDALFQTVDLLLSPVTVLPPHAADEPAPKVSRGVALDDMGIENFALWANVAGCPSIAIPAGHTRTGMPVGLLITGPKHGDADVLRLAWKWEQAHPWARYAPRPFRDSRVPALYPSDASATSRSQVVTDRDRGAETPNLELRAP